MMFWVLAAVLTAVVTVALLRPLARRGAAASTADHDVEVYSDQLAEVDRDLKNGLVGADEAEYARAEIGRRLLRASKPEGLAGERRSRTLRKAARVAVIVIVPVAAMGAYLVTGSPGVPHQPLASRVVPAIGGLENLLAQAERHLAENPQDGRGWNVLAPIYLRAGRFDDALTAYANAIRLLGPSAERQSGYGETLVALAGGIVTEQARVAFQSAREMAPDDPTPAFYLAMAMMQEGRDARALKAFAALAETSPPDAPWMVAVNAHITMLSGEVEEPDAAGNAATRAVTAAGAAVAAADMGPKDRQAMIGQMVDSLDARLSEDPNDIDGWIRLVRSYGVLGRTEEAGEALRRGLEVFPEESADGMALVAVAREAGVAVAGRVESR